MHEKMGDIQPSNKKLVIRARSILRNILSTLPNDSLIMVKQDQMDLNDDGLVDSLIEKYGGVKAAAVGARFGCSVDEANGKLIKVDGLLRKALQG